MLDLISMRSYVKNCVIAALYSFSPYITNGIDGAYRNKNIVLFDNDLILTVPILAFFIHMLILLGFLIYNAGVKNFSEVWRYLRLIVLVVSMSIIFFGASFLLILSSGSF